MSQQNLWSCHRVLTASYRVEHSSSMESRSSSAGSSAFIESSTQNWSSRLSTTEDRRGLETFCLETTKSYIAQYRYFSESRSNTYTVQCMIFFFFFLMNYQYAFMSCFIFMNIIKHLYDEIKGNIFCMMDLRNKR